MNDRAKGIGLRSVHLSLLSMFIRGLAMVIEADNRLHHGKYRTRAREPALVAKRTSVSDFRPLQSLPSPKKRCAEH